jgi:hypothetical protein
VLEFERGGNPAMPKFGLFGGNVEKPMQTYEGDRMDQNKEYVYIYKKEPMRAGDRLQRERQVAAIKLADGQSVKEI